MNTNIVYSESIQRYFFENVDWSKIGSCVAVEKPDIEIEDTFRSDPCESAADFTYELRLMLDIFGEGTTQSS